MATHTDAVLLRLRIISCARLISRHSRQPKPRYSGVSMVLQIEWIEYEDDMLVLGIGWTKVGIICDGSSGQARLNDVGKLSNVEPQYIVYVAEPNMKMAVHFISNPIDHTQLPLVDTPV